MKSDARTTAGTLDETKRKLSDTISQAGEMRARMPKVYLAMEKALDKAKKNRNSPLSR